MEQRTLHFSLGEKFGDLLGTIAQEHLIYNLDPQKALDTFTKSTGMDIDTAIKLLSGEDYVLKCEDGETVYMTERKESDTYPKLNAKEIVTQWKDSIAEECEEMNYGIARYLRKGNSCLTVDFDVEKLVDLFSSNSHDKSIIYDELIKQINELSQEDEDETTVNGDNCRKVRFIKFFNNWKESVYRKLQVVKFILDNKLADVDWEYYVIQENIDDVIKFYMDEMNYQTNGPKSIQTTSNEEDVKLNYIKENSIRVVKDNECVNAIWLSPEGVAYGCNGCISTMLHLQIADWLKDNGIINYDREIDVACNVDEYLEENGWCKIHNDFITYDPYAKDHEYDHISQRLTEKQVEFISKYFENNWKFMRCGFNPEKISYINFKNMDDIARNKLFL